MRGSAVKTEVVEPYAEALMSLAQSQNLTERIGEDISSLLNSLQNSADLQQFLGSPVINAEDKKSVLRQITRNEFHPYTLNILMLLVDRRRSLFLAAFCQKYQALLRDLNQTVLATVISAVELTADQQETVCNQVKAMTSARQVELNTQIDPDLIGGVIIKVGSQVIDASLRGQLKRIGIQLSGA